VAHYILLVHKPDGISIGYCTGSPSKSDWLVRLTML